MVLKKSPTPKTKVVVYILLVGLVIALFIKLVPKQKTENIVKFPIPKNGSIRLSGTFVCLPHTNSNGPQTMECAFGLKDDLGRFFGVQDTDPQYNNISSAPMNSRVEVTGSFEKKQNDTYPTLGVISITEIIQQP